MNESLPPFSGDAQPEITEAELLALLKDVREYWGKVEAHLMFLIGEKRDVTVDVADDRVHWDCGFMHDLVPVSKLRKETPQKISYAPPMFGEYVRAEVMLYPLEGVRQLACVSLDDGRLGLGIELHDGTRLDERWELVREDAPTKADDEVEPSTVGETPTVDVYGDDTSWMVHILQQLITGEDVTLPKRATDYSTGVDENDPSRFWLTVWRDDGSTITQAWSVKP